MNTIKVAVTIPQDLVEEIDAMSKEKGISRSRFITEVIREKILDDRNLKIKKTYDRVFSDDEIREEQLETARWFQGLENTEGQEW